METLVARPKKGASSSRNNPVSVAVEVVDLVDSESSSPQPKSSSCSSSSLSLTLQQFQYSASTPVTSAAVPVVLLPVPITTAATRPNSFPNETTIINKENKNKLQQDESSAPATVTATATATKKPSVSVDDNADKMLAAASATSSLRKKGGATAGTVKASKPRAPRAPAKSKIEKEYEKLTVEEKDEFLKNLGLNSNLGSVLVSSSTVQAKLPEDNNSQRCNSSTDEKEMMRLRLELGDVLNREAELRTKEKKLRLLIKKLQRKLTASHESILYDIKSENMDQVSRSLFPQIIQNNPCTNKSRGYSLSVCPLWKIAQQDPICDRLREEKRVSVTRDAILTETTDHIEELSSLIVESNNNSPENIVKHSIFSQVLNVLDDNTATFSQDKKGILDLANEWINAQLEDDGDMGAALRNIIEEELVGCPIKRDIHKMTVQLVQQLKLYTTEEYVCKLLLLLHRNRSIAESSFIEGAIIVLWTIISGLFQRTSSEIEPSNFVSESEISIKRKSMFELETEQCCSKRFKASQYTMDNDVSHCIDLTSTSPPTEIKEATSKMSWEQCHSQLDMPIQSMDYFQGEGNEDVEMTATIMKDSIDSAQSDKKAISKSAGKKGEEVTDSVMKQFLRSNLDLYQDILMYIPLNLDEVHRRIQEEGFKVSKEKLKGILDNINIFQSSSSKPFRKK